jgi:hypothetical protein
MLHLTTVVGGRVTTLRPMLQHYMQLGVKSFLVNVHLRHQDDPVLEEVRSITHEMDIPIASITVGKWQDVIRELYTRSRSAHPNDWHILADQDELHEYPAELSDITRMCDQRGYDFVRGCFVDRLAADGSLPPIHCSDSLFGQFPIGAFLSYPLAGASPRKIVLSRAHVEIVKGQHQARSGIGCPNHEAFVQVHHFKWVAGLMESLQERIVVLNTGRHRHFVESERIVRHLVQHSGRIDLADPRFLAARCDRDYPYWDLIKDWFTALDEMRMLSETLQEGPVNLPLWAREAARVAPLFAARPHGDPANAGR